MSGGTPTPVNGPGTGLDIQRPNVARMYDYYMRGKDNFAADREAADKVLTVAPDVPHAARENHRFLTRAIQFLTGEAGIGQFIDIGPGQPAQANLHHIVHRFDRTARVAYIDNDPAAVPHRRALLAGHQPAVTTTDGDLRDPGTILTHPDLRRLIHLDEPVALCMTRVLHFIPDSQEPHECVARLLDGLAPGSYLVLSHVTGDGRDDGIVKQITATYDEATAPLVMRGRDEVRRFFGECALVPPGVVYLTQWYRHLTAEPVLGDGGTRWAYAGVGIK